MSPEEAAERLVEALPEFRSDYERSDALPTEPEDDLLLHVLMDDLVWFYMREARGNRELARRFWRVVEELAVEGDEAVENAVHLSLVERFAGGTDDEQAALDEAQALQGSATWAMMQAYRARTPGSRSSDRRRQRRSRRTS